MVLKYNIGKQISGLGKSGLGRYISDLVRFVMVFFNKVRGQSIKIASIHHTIANRITDIFPGLLINKMIMKYDMKWRETAPFRSAIHDSLPLTTEAVCVKSLSASVRLISNPLKYP